MWCFIVSSCSHVKLIRALVCACPRPLCYASHCAHVDAVKELILGGADGNKGVPPPLCVAAQHGHTEVAVVLCSLGKADASKADGQGRTPLAYAEHFGHLELAAVLREHMR